MIQRHLLNVTMHETNYFYEIYMREHLLSHMLSENCRSQWANNTYYLVAVFGAGAAH